MVRNARPKGGYPQIAQIVGILPRTHTDLHRQGERREGLKDIFDTDYADYTVWGGDQIGQNRSRAETQRRTWRWPTV